MPRRQLVATPAPASSGRTRLSARGRRLVVGGSLVALLVPLSALWVPRFVLFSRLDLVDT